MKPKGRTMKTRSSKSLSNSQIEDLIDKEDTNSEVESSPNNTIGDVPVFSVAEIMEEGVQPEEMNGNSAIGPIEVDIPSAESSLTTNDVHIVDELLGVGSLPCLPVTNSTTRKRPRQQDGVEELNPSNKKLNFGGGRPKSGVWSKFVTLIKKGKKCSSCKVCGKVVSSKADRLSKHTEECEIREHLKEVRKKALLELQPAAAVVPSSKGSVSGPDVVSNTAEVIVSAPGLPVSAPVASAVIGTSTSSLKQRPMVCYLDSMSKQSKDNIDKKLAQFIYHKNLPFNTSEDPKFVELLHELRPSYKPPNRHAIGGSLLDEAYKTKQEEMQEFMGGKKVCIMQDGWSSIHSEPVIVHAMSDCQRTVFLSSIDAEDNVKTAEYSLSLLQNAIKEAENNYGVSVIGFLTDNCNTMKKLRRLVHAELPDMFVYGCNTHLLNLIGKDLTDKVLLEKVLDVNKYFKNHNYESARLTILNGKRPVLAADTRWNSQVEVFQNFIENQAKYLQISREKKSSLYDKESTKGLRETINSSAVFAEVSSAVRVLEPIAKHLDQLQSDKATYADAVSVWFQLKNSLEFDSVESKRQFKKRFKMAITDPGIVSYMFHPKYRGELLPDKYLERGRNWLADKSAFYVILFANFQSENTAYYPKSMMNREVSNQMDPFPWWRAVGKTSNSLSASFLDLMESLMQLPASTSGLERSLSTMSNIVTKNRNRLGLEKAEKLCFVNFHSHQETRNNK